MLPLRQPKPMLPLQQLQIWSTEYYISRIFIECDLLEITRQRLIHLVRVQLMLRVGFAREIQQQRCTIVIVVENASVLLGPNTPRSARTVIDF